MNNGSRNTDVGVLLIADDNPDMIYLVKKALKGESYQFIEAYDGEAALTVITTRAPDVVLLDLKMPVIDGFTVLQKVKENPLLEDIPILVLTVVSDETQKLRALQLGANDFIQKPPHPSELKARIKTYHRLRQITKDLKQYSEKLEKLVDKKTKELRNYTNKLERLVEKKVGVIKKQNEELRLSIRAAQKVQQSTLPSILSVIKGVQFTAHYIPYEMIGGDFYNVFRIDENHLGICIADVSGHGVPSAMITIFLKQEILYHSKRIIEKKSYHVTSPGDLLTALNESFIKSNIGEGFFYITMVYCIYNQKTKRLVCSLAGHHAFPLIIRKNNTAEVIEMKSFPIGWFDKIPPYQNKEFNLDFGDSIFFYTDGLFDIINTEENESSFKENRKRLKTILTQKRGMAYIDTLLEKYKKLKSNIRDDVAVLYMKLQK